MTTVTKIAPEQETPRAEMQEVETKKSRTRRKLNNVVSGLKPPYSSRARRVALYLGLLVAVLSVSSVVGQQFPTSFRVPFGSATEVVFEWGIDHLAWLYEPVAESLEDVLVSMQFMLVDLPAPLLALLLIGIAYARCGPLIAGLLTVALGFVISVGLWDETLQTLVLMVVAVVIAVILGILIGVAAQMNRRFEAFVLIALDAMQTFPVFAYLVPIVFIFGPGNTGALIVTIIWALPPVTRMTILGIKTVPSESIEAATSCGSTGWQILRNVQIPLARPSIMAGVNQTVMFAMSMAIVAAMIGAGGLGQSVWGSLTRLAFGQALEAGIALVLFAIVLDRVTGQGKKSTGHGLFSDFRTLVTTTGAERPALVKRAFQQHRRTILTAAVLFAGTIYISMVPALRFANFETPPESLRLSFADPVDQAVDWLNLNLGFILDVVVDGIQGYVLNGVTALLLAIPWPAVFFVVVGASLLLRGIRGAALAAAGLLGIGVLGMWEAAAITLGIAGAAVLVSLFIGLPIGAVMSRSIKLERTIRPVLDVMQTLPVFLFVIPIVVVLGTGAVAGLLATVLYCLPPVIRLTNVALRGVDSETVEAATSTGATEWQLLRTVKIPLGMPTIMIGINQAIILSLAMAVVSAFIGTPGLGQALLTGVVTARLDLGIEAGVAMFLLAVVVDRLVTGVNRKIQAHSHLVPA